MNPSLLVSPKGPPIGPKRLGPNMAGPPIIRPPNGWVKNGSSNGSLPPKEARDQAPLGTKPSKRVPATKEIAPSVPPSVHFSSDLADPVVAATVTETISDLEWNTSQSNMHEILRTGFFQQTLITKFKSEEVACSRNTNTTELGTSLNWQD
jgi:hypothetical protein